MWKIGVFVSFLVFYLDVGGEQLFGDHVHSRQLLDHLTEAEKTLIFGTNPYDSQFEIAHVKNVNRGKRSVDQEHESLKSRLKLERNDLLLDPHFLVLKRGTNESELSLRHAEEANNCYYRSPHAALYLCRHVRGLVKSGENYYSVHPLPDRFHNEYSKAHVIIKRIPEEIAQNRSQCANREKQKPESWSPRRETCQPETNNPRRERREVTDKIKDFEEFKGSLANKLTLDEIMKKIVNTSDKIRHKRASPPTTLFVETAVFVDRDLYEHMKVNFPKETEREVVRFVLAMVNAVQLLYHDPSLGRAVSFILKRLEILHEDPAGLRRAHDIDRLLSDFCAWQRLENPPGDSNPLHWDHALLLTGLDLYVVAAGGAVSSQVVGLAPVSGMCTATSSCTVNEGRHFESVYVVAHEIGHNLGMRHDGLAADNGCDPSAYIMSPTLGSGKITWSPCSRNYLDAFLRSGQAGCLRERGSSAGQLDHGAEGALPGERFPADTQCMLKYGRGSRRSETQSVGGVCRDLHCTRDRRTWTSHPALDGTSCGHSMYCRGGECVERADEGAGSVWGRWGPWSDCASSCLTAPTATGLATAARRCRHRHGAKEGCDGADRKYRTCDATQCLSEAARMSAVSFADEVCARARRVDPDLIGTSAQLPAGDSDSDEDLDAACSVWCDKRGGGYKSRGWLLPDGASCGPHHMYCINGRCRRFSCDDDEYSLSSEECEQESLQPQPSHQHQLTATNESSGAWRREASSNGWRATGGCHYHCVTGGTGLRLVRGSTTSTIQLCSPDHERAMMGCRSGRSSTQYATLVCAAYRHRVRRLSGLGVQITPNAEEPDRACRVACQDERVPHRFYLVNGREGWFPLGTRCNNASYCVSGKCLEFGEDGTPRAQFVWSLPRARRSLPSLDRNRSAISRNIPRSSRSISRSRRSISRSRRSMLPERVSVLTALPPSHLAEIIAHLNLTASSEHEHVTYCDAVPDHVELDFSRPLHLSPQETTLHKQRPTWD